MADLPAEFYLETVDRVFQQHRLPRGRLEWQGGRVEPRAIRRTALFTVEGEQRRHLRGGPDRGGPGPLHEPPADMRRHHVQTGVGHYGVFNGGRWRAEIYPKVRSLIQASS